MFNYTCIFTWVNLQFYEKLYNNRNFVIRTIIRLPTLGYTYKYTTGYINFTRVYIQLYE